MPSFCLDGFIGLHEYTDMNRRGRFAVIGYRLQRLKALAPVTARLDSKEPLEEQQILPDRSESMDMTELRLDIKLEQFQ